MGTRKPVLPDHRRIKFRLVTPFSDVFDPLHEVPWVGMT